MLNVHNAPKEGYQGKWIHNLTHRICSYALPNQLRYIKLPELKSNHWCFGNVYIQSIIGEPP